MSHYAKINNGLVENIIIADEDYFDTFVDDSPGTWIKTNYGSTSVGDSYDSETNIFTIPKIYPSWILNKDNIWEAPIACPGDSYEWDEENQIWNEVVMVPSNDK